MMSAEVAAAPTNESPAVAGVAGTFLTGVKRVIDCTDRKMIPPQWLYSEGDGTMKHLIHHGDGEAANEHIRVWRKSVMETFRDAFAGLDTALIFEEMSHQQLCHTFITPWGHGADARISILLEQYNQHENDERGEVMGSDVERTVLRLVSTWSRVSPVAGKVIGSFQDKLDSLDKWQLSLSSCEKKRKHILTCFTMCVESLLAALTGGLQLKGGEAFLHSCLLVAALREVMKGFTQILQSKVSLGTADMANLGHLQQHLHSTQVDSYLLYTFSHLHHTSSLTGARGAQFQICQSQVGACPSFFGLGTHCGKKS